MLTMKGENFEVQFSSFINCKFWSLQIICSKYTQVGITDVNLTLKDTENKNL